MNSSQQNILVGQSAGFFLSLSISYRAVPFLRYIVNLAPDPQYTGGREVNLCNQNYLKAIVHTSSMQNTELPDRLFLRLCTYYYLVQI